MKIISHSKLDSTTDGAPGAAAPAAPAPAAAPVGDESSPAKWDNLLADDPADLDDTQPPSGDSGAPAAPPAAAAPPPPATPPAAAAPASPPAPPAAPAAPAPAAPPVDPEAQRKAAEEAEKQVETQLTQLFESGLDEDTRAALIADPAAVMGKLLARAAMTGAQMALSQVPRMVPQMVSTMSAQERAQRGAWEAFTAKNSDLADPKFAPSLQIAAQTLKATGKTYTDDEAIATLGRMVRVMHGLSEPGSAPPAPPAAPAPVPFTPVARGGAAPTPVPKSAGRYDDLLD